MRNLFFLAALFMFPRLLFCQIYFNNDYNINQHQGASSIIEDSGYLILGQEITATYRSFYFIKINLNGDTIWTRNYPKSQYAYYTGSSNSLIKTIDNNYVFGGTLINLQDTMNTGDCLLVKLNTNGDTLWTRNYGGSNYDYANIVCQTPDSGFVLMGSTESFSNGPAADFYLIKIDKNGIFQWQHTYGTTATEECYSGQITLDGGYIMAGHRSNQLHIVKTDAVGTFQWEKVYSGTAGQGFIKQLPDSTYIIVGAKNVTGLGAQAYMAKLTKSGIIIWQQTYGGVGDQQFYAVPIILNDGSIVCSGVSTISSIPDGLLVKTDSLGNQQWLRTYISPTNIVNYLYDVKHTSDNGFIMCGQAYSTLTDFWAVKVDSNGCEYAGCNVGVEELGIRDERIGIYPNPSSGEFEVNFYKECKEAKLEIRNVMGQLVYMDEIKNRSVVSIKLDVEAGIYFVSVEADEGTYIMKLIKE